MCDNLSGSDTSIISDIGGQVDGNTSICSNQPKPSDRNVKTDKFTVALSLPTVATYNCRSLFAKVESLKRDLLERAIDVGFLVEIWEQSHNSEHRYEIEKMLELSGLQYISTASPRGCLMVGL